MSLESIQQVPCITKLFMKFCKCFEVRMCSAMVPSGCTIVLQGLVSFHDGFVRGPEWFYDGY